MTITRGLRQAYDVQNLMHAALIAIQEQIRIDDGGTYETLRVRPPTKDEAAVLAALGKVWKDAQEQIRIHKGKPLPGSLTHEKVGRGRSKRSMLAGLSSLAAHLPADDVEAEHVDGTAQTSGEQMNGEQA